jgi:hypothetical protein
MANAVQEANAIQLFLHILYIALGGKQMGSFMSNAGFVAASQDICLPEPTFFKLCT